MFLKIDRKSGRKVFVEMGTRERVRYMDVRSPKLGQPVRKCVQISEDSLCCFDLCTSFVPATAMASVVESSSDDCSTNIVESEEETT